MLIHTSDDRGALGFDGALVDAGVNSTRHPVDVVVGGRNRRRVGQHSLRHRPLRQLLQLGGQQPGAFACIGYQQVVSPFLQYENVKFRTGSDTTGGDPMLGGDWLCTYRNAGDPEPGFTPGRAFRIPVRTGPVVRLLRRLDLELHGHRGLQRDAWPSTSLLSARVADDTLLDVIRNWHDLGYWDAWSSPNTKTLNATVWGNRATSTSVVLPSTGTTIRSSRPRSIPRRRAMATGYHYFLIISGNGATTTTTPPLHRRFRPRPCRFDAPWVDTEAKALEFAQKQATKLAGGEVPDSTLIDLGDTPDMGANR